MRNESFVSRRAGKREIENGKVKIEKRFFGTAFLFSSILFASNSSANRRNILFIRYGSFKKLRNCSHYFAGPNRRILPFFKMVFSSEMAVKRMIVAPGVRGGKV